MTDHLFADLAAFLAEHERCGDLDTGMTATEPARVRSRARAGHGWRGAPRRTTHEARLLTSLAALVFAGCGVTPVTLLRIPGTAEYVHCSPNVTGGAALLGVVGAMAETLDHDNCVRLAKQKGYVVVSGPDAHDEIEDDSAAAMKVAAVLVVAVSLSGCAMGPRGQLATFDIPPGQAAHLTVIRPSTLGFCCTIPLFVDGAEGARAVGPTRFRPGSGPSQSRKDTILL